MTNTYTARFVPQAWIGGHALDIDIQPDQQTEWDCTADLLDRESIWRDACQGIVEDADDAFGEEVMDINDVLKDRPDTPRWIANHAGPFSIFVRRDKSSDADAVARQIERILARRMARSPLTMFDEGAIMAYNDAIELLKGA